MRKKKREKKEKSDIKDAVISIEKEVLHIEKDIEKTVKKSKLLKWTLIISAAIIILFVIALFFGIKISFILKDELQIGLEPLQKSLYLAHNDSETIDFIITNKNFRSCKSY